MPWPSTCNTARPPHDVVMKRLLLSFLLVVSARADVTFVFDYGGSPNFSAATALGQQRRAALEDAGAQLGSLFLHEVTIQIRVTSVNDPGVGTLASAVSFYAPVPVGTVGFLRGVVHEKIITGVDGNGTAPDGELEINVGQPWDYDDDIDPQRWDFKGTVIHELMHALGFGTGIDNSGQDTWGSGIGNPGLWEVYDEFLGDAEGRRLIDDNTFVLDRPAWLSLRGAGSNGLHFLGPAAVAANGGRPVSLYSPAVFEDGSSHSHLNDQIPAFEGALMTPAVLPGPSERGLNPVEFGILRDLGYLLKGAVGEIRFTSCSVSGDDFFLRLSAPPNRRIQIEGVTELGTDNWEPLLTVSSGSGVVGFSVPQNGGHRSFRGIVLDVP